MYEKYSSHFALKREHKSGTTSYGHTINRATLLLWPLYHGPNKSRVSHLKTLLNAVTALIGPVFFGLLVTTLATNHRPQLQV